MNLARTENIVKTGIPSQSGQNKGVRVLRGTLPPQIGSLNSNYL